MELMEDAHLAASLSSSSKDGIAEMVLGNNLRTTEGEEDAAGLNNLERLLVETRVAFQRIVEGTTVLGKGRRVEDNEVVLLTVGRFEELECILAESLMTLIAREVEGHIAVGEFNSLGTGVDRVDYRCSSPHGIERETTCVAEHIEQTAAVSIVLEQRTVLTMVNEEAGLLSAQPVNIEQQTILDSNIIRTATIEKAVLRLHIGQRRLALIVDIFYAITHHGNELFGYLFAAEVHPDAMCLHDSGFSVDINNESGQMVTFAMDEAVGVVCGRIGQLDGLSQVECRLQARCPELVVDGNIAE